MALTITPLPADSPKGRELTERLTNTLADLELAVAERKRAATRKSDAERGAA